MSALNDYILAAQSTGDNNFFSYFLHHYERQLNSRIYSFLQSDGSDQYDPERFLDLKLSYFCRLSKAYGRISFQKSWFAFSCTISY